jgi:hypothetical protein
MPAFFTPNIEIVPQGQREFVAITRRCSRAFHAVSRNRFFGSLPLARVEDALLTDDNRIHVASLLDVGEMKLAVSQKRAEAKDYLDIEALLDAGQTLDRLVSAGVTIYGKQFNPAVAVRALSFWTI